MYIFLQQYWWLVVSLLGAILVFLLFVQGGNSLLFCLGKTEEHRKMMVNSTGRKVLSLLRSRCFTVPVSVVLIGFG